MFARARLPALSTTLVAALLAALAAGPAAAEDVTINETAQSAAQGIQPHLSLESRAERAARRQNALAERLLEGSQLEQYSPEAGKVINSGLSFVGTPYRFGGNSVETGFDCSGLVRKVFGDALGLPLPRRAEEISRLGRSVALGDLAPGDLVFFNTWRRAYSHVGIYLGNNRFLHAPSSGGKVRVDDLTQPYWVNHFNGARRIVEKEPNS